MSKTIKYIGTQKRWPELAATGKQAFWMPGRQDERSDVEALQLLGTGLFEEVGAAPVAMPMIGAVADATGVQVGLPGNMSEALGDAGVIPNALLYTAPLATPIDTAVDCGAYWYNDFGLEWTRLNAGSTWMGWYDWRHNHRGTDGYQPADWTPTNYAAKSFAKGSDGVTYMALQPMTSGAPKNPTDPANAAYWRARPTAKYYPDRHPMLGWYRGDDAKVISWQVKWLVEHGCKWAVIQQRAFQPDDFEGGLVRWANPESLANWIYKLVNDRAVAAGYMKLAFWMPHSTSDSGHMQALLPINGMHDSSLIYTPGMRVCTVANRVATYYLNIQQTTAGILISNTAYWTPIVGYVNNVDYPVGRVLIQSDKFYVCIAPNGPATTIAAPGNTAFWLLISDFNSSASANYTPGMVAIPTTGNDNRHYVCVNGGTGAALGVPSSSNPNWALRQFFAAGYALGLKYFVDFHNTHKTKVKTITKGGKTYLATLLWESEVLRAKMGHGNALIELLQQMGAYVNSVNPAWDGVAPLMRNSTSPTSAGGALDYVKAEQTGRVLLIRTDYPGTAASTGAVEGADGYQSLIDNFGPTFSSNGQAAAVDKRVYCVPTALTTVGAHDSTYRFEGHSPAKFGAYMAKARKHGDNGLAFKGDDGKQVLLVYNVQEWAEAGPGLQPNMQDGFGYLTAMKRAVV